jgi:hypothetical protein
VPFAYYLAVPSELDVLRDRLRNFAAVRGWGSELGAELKWIDDAEVGRHLEDPAARARIARGLACAP